jgi:hypothetical protein
VQTQEADINKDEQIVPNSIQIVAGVVSGDDCSGILRSYRDQTAFDYLRRQSA